MSANAKSLMQLNFFEAACTGSHTAIGQWKYVSKYQVEVVMLILNRDPADNSRTKDRLDYWLWLAKLAEKGKITSIFIADSYAGHNIYGGSADASYKGGSHIGKLDPLTIVSAMGAVTKTVSFGITASTSYIGKSLTHNLKSCNRF